MLACYIKMLSVENQVLVTMFGFLRFHCTLFVKCDQRINIFICMIQCQVKVCWHISTLNAFGHLQMQKCAFCIHSTLCFKGNKYS